MSEKAFNRGFWSIFAADIVLALGILLALGWGGFVAWVVIRLVRRGP
jgi:hypothetical protein